MPAPVTESLNDLREKRNEVAGQIKEIRTAYEQHKADGKQGDERWGGKEGRAKFAALDKRKKELDAQIEDIEIEQRLFAMDEEKRSDPEPARFVNGINHAREEFEQRRVDRRLALRSWAAHGSRGHVHDKRAQEACQRLGFDPTANDLACELSHTEEFRALQEAHREGRAREFCEKRSLSALNPSLGATTVGMTLVNQIELNMLYAGSVEQISDIILTDGGEPMSWPGADDTSNEGSQVGENQAQTSTDPSFKAVRWNAYEFSSDIVKAPRSLIQDSGVDIEASIGQMLGGRVARGFNRKCTTGVGGGSTPYGYITSGTLGKTTASATAVTREEILDLIHSVDAEYRNDGCRLVMHDLILAELRKLKDSQNRPLDLVTYGADGLPRFREGNYRIAVNNHQDSTLTTTQKTIAFGDFTKGKIRRVRQIVVSRLVERYAEYNQIGFLTIVRQDYNVLNVGTAPIKYLKQA